MGTIRIFLSGTTLLFSLQLSQAMQHLTTFFDQTLQLRRNLLANPIPVIHQRCVVLPPPSHPSNSPLACETNVLMHAAQQWRPLCDLFPVRTDAPLASRYWQIHTACSLQVMEQHLAFPPLILIFKR